MLVLVLFLGCCLGHVCEIDGRALGGRRVLRAVPDAGAGALLWFWDAPLGVG